MNRAVVLVTCVLIAAIVISCVSLNRAIRACERADQAEGRADRLEAQVNQLQTHVKYVKLLRLAAMVENTLRPLDASPFDRAVRIRNHLHHNVATKPSSEWFDTMDFDSMYAKTMRDEESGHLCGGMTLLYVAALESQGIPSRYVGIFSSDKVPYTSHATAEFWHNGKWYASDPTNNIMFMHEGCYLSYAEVFERAQKGLPYEVTSNRYPVLPARKIDNYAVVLNGFMKYMVIHPNEVCCTDEALPQKSKIQTTAFSYSQPGSHDGSPGPLGASVLRQAKRDKAIHYPMLLFPRNWDGAITFADGKRTDVRAFGGLYAFLHDGPLR